MKSWAIRILLLSSVGMLGWLTVAVAQKQFGLYDAPPPDFSKPPVNSSDAVPAVATAATPVGRATPVDPFQGIEKTEGRTATAQTPVEPSRLEADPCSAPIARDPAPAHNSLRDDIPSAAETGLADSNSAPHRSGSSTPAADPFAAPRESVVRSNTVEPADESRTTPPSDPRATTKSGDRYSRTASPRDSGDRYGTYGGGDGVVPASGIVSATGSLEAVDSANSNPSASSGTPNDLTSGNRYQSLPNRPSTAAGPSSHSDENLLRPASSASTDAPTALLARNMPAVAALPASASMNLEGMGRPGDKKLEGAQSPSVTLEKIAPPEIQVGKAAKFEIMVRNVGPVEAADVEVTDAVPQGTQLLGTTPKATVGSQGEIVWKLGNLKSGEESKLQVEVMPLTEGEIGSVAVVQFRSTASMRTIATKPELVLELNSPKQVMIGGDVTINLKLSNPGTGAANKVVLTEKVPAGLQHPAGTELEFEVGTLKPGESRQLDLTLHAVQAGKFANTMVVEGDANLHTEKVANIEVIAPALSVALNGPGLRYLDRQAKYTVSVTNPGTAPAKEIELTTQLPKGMQFVEASDSGHYDPSSHSVIWSLAELPPGQSGSVTLTALAKEAGEQKFRTQGRGEGGLNDVNEQTTIVEGVAEVLFTVTNIDDPVEVGGQATYEIHVVNQGSKAANRVQVGALLPNEMKPTGAEGPAKFAIDGQRVVFDALARLAPKADVTYRVVGQCLAPGDLRVKVQLQTDEMAQPVTKEESTKVYKD